MRRRVTVQSMVPLLLVASGCGGDDAPAAPRLGPPPEQRFVLERLPPLAGGSRAAALAINGLDDVVGFSSVPTSVAHPVIWVGSSVIDLGLPPGASFAIAYDINDSRMVVGEAADVTDNFGFVWKDGAFTVIRDGSGPQRLAATSVNNHGVVVGTSWGHAFRYTAGSGLVDIHPGAGYELSTAVDVSDAGVIAGSAKRTTGAVHAVMWSAEGVFTDLGSLGGDTWATGVRDDGTVVGSTRMFDGTLQAFVWTEATGLRADGVPGEANGISPSGRIVGSSIELAAGDVRISHPSTRLGTGEVVILPTLTEERIGRAVAVNHCGSIAGAVALGNQARAARWRISRCD